MAGVDPVLLQFGWAIVAGAFAAGGAWLAVRTEMKYLRRDTDKNTADLGQVEIRRQTDVQLLHERINRLGERVNQACAHE